MKRTNKRINLMILLFASTLFGASTSFANASWGWCYNRAENRIYFQSQNDLAVHKGKCKGSTYFDAKSKSNKMSNFTLITDGTDAHGFPRGENGSSMNIELNNGRNLLVTHWTDLSKSNYLVVLEPDMKNRTVKRHCSYRNFSNSFDARKNKQAKRFEVKIRKPINTHSDDFHTVWVPCKI